MDVTAISIFFVSYLSLVPQVNTGCLNDGPPVMVSSLLLFPCSGLPSAHGRSSALFIVFLYNHHSGLCCFYWCLCNYFLYCLFFLSATYSCPLLLTTGNVIYLMWNNKFAIVVCIFIFCFTIYIHEVHYHLDLTCGTLDSCIYICGYLQGVLPLLLCT